MPLFAGQARLWLAQALEPESPLCNIAIAHHLLGRLDAARLDRAIRAVTSRHEMMQASFIVQGATPYQRVSEPDSAQTKLVQLSAPDLRAARRLAEEHARIPFDLSRAPLWRFVLFRISESEHLLLVLSHHIVSDRWSHGIVARELSTFYNASSAGGDTPLAGRAPLYTQFMMKEFASEDALRREQHRAFWAEALGRPLQRLELPIDQPAGSGESYRGIRVPFEADALRSARLDALAKAFGVTPFVVILSSMAVLLHRHTRQEDLIFCTPIAGRHRAASREIVGYFNNLIPIRICLSGLASLREVVAETERSIRSAFTHLDHPFQEIASITTVPLARCLVSVQNTLPLNLTLQGIESSYEDVPTGTSNFDLAVFVERVNDAYSGFLDAKLEPRSEQSLRLFKDRLLDTMSRVLGNPDLSFRTLTAYEADARVAARAVDPAVAADVPRSELERSLIQVWEGVLEISGLNRESHFFDLGGDSLLAARVMEGIGANLGRELPLSFLLRAPTIRGLADLITQEGFAPSWSSLVPIKPEGNSTPLFLVHAGGGGVISYRRLARYLPAEQPVWGLESRGDQLDGAPEQLVHRLARAYEDAIRTIQPHGPYALGGHSFGALVAIEMAHRLIDAGEMVELLAIIDHPGPDARPRWTDRLRWHWICLGQLDGPEKLRYIQDRVGWRLRGSRWLPRIVREAAAGRFRDADGARKASWRLRNLNASLQALESYHARPVDTRIALFRAKLASPVLHADPFGGWLRIGKRGVAVYDLPGSHMDILQEPHVQTLAGALTEALPGCRGAVRQGAGH